MQRLLTEEEYQELVSRGEKVVQDQQELVQKLCTMVAESKPVKYWGNKEARIWGCIHNQFPMDRVEGVDDLSQEEYDTMEAELEELHPSSEHCCECPVRKECPSRKSYSQ